MPSTDPTDVRIALVVRWSSRTWGATNRLNSCFDSCRSPSKDNLRGSTYHACSSSLLKHSKSFVENSGPLSTGKGRSRNWTLREDRILLDLLIDVHHKTHSSQGTFKAHVFQDILHQFNTTANVIKDRDSLKYRWRNIKKVYHIYEQLRTRSGWGWDDERNLPVPPDEESIHAAIAINSDYKKYIDKSFPYKRQLDILCGKTTVRGSHFMGSTQDVDVEATRSFGDDDSADRQQFNAIGLESSQFQSMDGDNFNPFDFPSSSQPNPPSRSVGEKTPTNIHPVEDEATSPTRRRTDHASTGYTQQLLFLASTLFEKPEKRAWFMALDDEDALPWILNATS
ncbi:hypothetical protein Taro_002352 [Colocasia esculenta]|uniref:Myb/SANT-like domain-containing protein n=1 Tax=Colocasia esculenta TaxID=4460 RepID=A0A843TKK7_COLES|nr:hypothetical protein [Colocasia esculenta]